MAVIVENRNILDISDLEMVIINMHPSFLSIFKSKGIDSIRVVWKSTLAFLSKFQV